MAGVAQSLDDYYTGVGEAAGQWLGAGAERLGLDGEVQAEDLRAVLAGLAPGSGGLTPDDGLVRTNARRVPGFDLTFKAPKSVSVLYAVSDDPRVQGAIIDAGEVAVRATLSWLEREAIRVRRGTGNEAWLNDVAARDPAAAEAARIRSLPGRGVIAATFRHRTSRAGDPLLHWHTLVANMVEGPDGRWTAFVHPELYRAVRAAGEIFQTALRAELTDRLGLQWRTGRHVPEVAGVPASLCELFSKRSREIEAWLDATGTPDDPAGRQEAVLATRRGKPELEGERFDALWKAEAIAAGWGPEQADALIDSTADRRAPDIDEVWRLPSIDNYSGEIVDRAVDPEDWIAALGRTLTEHDSTFSRHEVSEAVAASVGDGATVATVERMTARVLASSQIVPIADEVTARWTTIELLDVERQFLHTARSTRDTRDSVSPARVAEVLAAGERLGDDQTAAVRVLTGSNDAVSVMVGPAGTGKTYTLDAVRRVFDAAGFTVHGVAPSARAAHELEADAHITSSTIHRLAGSWERGFNRPTRSTVLVVDEAGMAGIRDLQRIVAPVVAAGGRVLLVGDHYQLPEVTAGGGFAALATDKATTVAELTVNRRQHEPWERDALAELRDGRVAVAVNAYRTHERVHVVDDRAEMITAGVERWLDAHHHGMVPVLLAGTNEIVDALNQAVRRQLQDHGVLAEQVGDRGLLAIGERLMVRINDYHTTTTDGRETAVFNGQTATLTGVHEAGLVVRMDHDGTDIVLDHDFFAAGGITHAYASTAHKAQGGTWDLAITVGLDGLYRESGYLVMSRGRTSNWLVITAPEIASVDADLARHDSAIPLSGEEPDDIDETLINRLSTSRRKLLAVTRDPQAEAIQHASTTLEFTVLEGWARHAAAVEVQAARVLGDDPHRQRGHLERMEHTARHAAVTQLVKAWDRRNVGTITAIDDAAGSIEVTFVAADGRIAARTMGWGDVTIVLPRHPPSRAMSPDAHATLDRLTTDLRVRLQHWDDYLARHGVQPDDSIVYHQATTVAADRAAALLSAAQPHWLTDLIGARPADPPAAVQIWDDAVLDIATHRLRNQITDPSQPIGPDATGTQLSRAWAAASPTAAATRLWLETHTNGPRLSVVRARSHPELYTRRAQLDQIFADAPADARGLINRLQTGGMLPLDDIAELLSDALAAQGARRRWILEHWPHVVEAAEIEHAISNHVAGPDIAPLIDALSTSHHRRLASAAATPEPWLLTLAGQLTLNDATSIDPATERLLADIADYRHRWRITARAPLGDAATGIDQANHRAVLATAIDQALGLITDSVPATELLLGLSEFRCN